MYYLRKQLTFFATVLAIPISALVTIRPVNTPLPTSPRWEEEPSVTSADSRACTPSTSGGGLGWGLSSDPPGSFKAENFARIEDVVGV
ncbi:MAG: hypothetical protein RLZZ612_165 [Pseudomonadota bacterium]|jgi:hypothetical protein